MKLESQNPVFARYQHLLSPNGRYPAKHVDIFWNRDDDHRISNVEVVFVPRAALRDQELQAEYAHYNKRWTSDLGNSTADWLEENGYTPEDVFGHLLRQGFASEDVTLTALREFAHIEECEWARVMLRGFRDE